MTDLPSLTVAFYGIIIIGVGYMGLWIKYDVFKTKGFNFYKDLPSYDKTIQSLILGTLTLLITSFILKIDISVFTTTETFIPFLQSGIGIMFVIFDIAILGFLSILWVMISE